MGREQGNVQEVRRSEGQFISEEDGSRVRARGKV
jgi:hypothetical protein